jgi:hypothetical protein
MRLDAIARRHGGNVDKYLGDCILAVFGVPTAVEGAPQAALNAAIEMHRSVEDFNRERGLELPLRVHTGINTGLVISGDVSGPAIREFSVMGDAVNVAARLKDLAPPDQIWVGGPTWEATRDLFDFRPLEPMQLKGKQESVDVYELVSRTVHLDRPERPVGPLLRSPLVGRAADLERLEASAGALDEGRGRVVALVGEAGIGKTRLAAELREHPAFARASWAFGRCVTIGSQLPFHPIVDLLRRWAGITGDEGPAMAREKLRDALEAELKDAEVSRDLLPPLAKLLGLEPEGGEGALAGLEGDTLERVLLRGVSQLFQHVATDGPLVIAIEDLHWADRSSLGFLASLALQLAGSPILLLLTTRPNNTAVEEMLDSLGPMVVLDEVRLAPLDRGATEEVLDHLTGRGDVAPQLRERIEAHAEGNPFFLEEIVRSLVEADVLEARPDGLWTTNPTAEVELPTTVGEVLAARLDRLDAASRNVLEAASVIGRHFRHGVLTKVLSGEQTEAALERLVDLELLEVRHRGELRRYAFKHPLIQETAYEILSHGRRRSLHLRVAEAIEEIVEAITPGYAGMLAYHFGLAGETERAEPYLFRAGDDAARVAASSEALHYFQNAYRLYLETAGESCNAEKLARLEQKIARAWFNRGELGEASAHFNLALEHLGERPAQGRLSLGWRLGTTLALVGARLYLRRWLEGRRPATDRDREIIALMFDRSRAQTTGDPARFLVESMETIRKIQSVDPKTVPGSGGMFAASIGTFSFSGLSFALGERFLARGQELVDRDDLREHYLFRFMRFSHHFLAGDWSDALEIDPGDNTEALRAGALWDVTTYLGLLADKKVVQGRFDEATALLEQIGKIESQYLYDLAASNRQFVALLLELERGELARGERLAEAHARENEEAVLRVLSFGYLAKIRCLRGGLAGARDALERGEGEAKTAGFVPPFELGALVTARAQVDVAELAAEGPGAGRGRRARRSAHRALRLARKVAWHRPEAARLAGIAAALSGRTRAARDEMQRSLAEAEALGMTGEIPRTRKAIAEYLGDGAV